MCKEWGFFYLELSGNTSTGNLQNAQALFESSERNFTKPVEDKMSDTRAELSIYNICG